MDRPDWIVYVKTFCPWCIQATRYLDKRGYQYRSVNVSRDAAAFQRMEVVSGQTLTPTLSIGDGRLVLADFDTGQLEVFLKQHDLQPG